MRDRTLRPYAGQTLHLAHSCGHVTREEVSVNASGAALSERLKTERERPCRDCRSAAERARETPEQRAARVEQDRELWN